MRKKLALVTLTMLMGVSMVACNMSSEKITPDTSATPAASADASTTPAASDSAEGKEEVYSQEQEAELQTRDISKYITLGKYKGVSVAAVDATVTDEAVENEIQSTLKSSATYTETAKDYKAADGDQVVIDYVGKIDGKAFDNGSADDQTLLIGAGQYIDGFEEGIIGHTAGTTFDINVTFPENYSSTDLAGKAATFTITLDSIKNTVIPELNDAFVKANSETSKTVAEYRKEVKESLETSAKESKATQEEDAVWDAILEASEVEEYPEDLVEYYAYTSEVQITTQLASTYNVTLEDYLTTMNISEEDFKKERVEDAKAYLKKLMVLQKIAKDEKLEVTDEQYQEQLQKVLDSNNLKTEAELTTNYGNLAPVTLKKSILYDNVTDYIVDNAVIK